VSSSSSSSAWLPRAALAAVATAGCAQLLGIGDGRLGDPADGGNPSGDGGNPLGPDAATIDGGGNVPDAASCAAGWTFTPTNVDLCALAASNGTVTVLADQPYTYDSDTGTLNGGNIWISAVLSQTSGPALRVVTFDGFSVQTGAQLKLVGSRPVVFVADTVTVDGGSLLTVQSGGRPASACAAGNGPKDPSIGVGGAGGGGGALGAAGGQGGPLTNTTQAGVGGVPVSGAAAQLSPLIGGCAGGTGGGFGQDNSIGGLGGAGGGSLQLVARVSLSLGGTIVAPGQGGSQVRGAEGGGGGGGSGGAIFLESPAINVAGALCANGGSGSEGASASDTNAGVGSAGTCSATQGAVTPAVSSGGDGGGGGFQGMHAGGAGGESLTSDGGGGGGGGVGIIRIRQTSGAPMIGAGVVISPAPLVGN
jgi:hypothetical protein